MPRVEASSGAVPFLPVSDERSARAALLRAEQALTRLAGYQRAIDQHAILVVTDRQGRILRVNERFCQISGYSAAELVGRTHAVVNSGVHPREFWVDMWRTIGQGRTWRGEICNRRKDGTLYWVDSSVVPLRDQSGTVEAFMAIRTDVSERKAAEAALLLERERLKEAKERAEAVAQARSEFLATMSHEIRTPMNGVLGMLSMLLKTELDGRQRDWVEVAERSARGLVSVIDDVLDLSKLDAGKVELEHVRFNPRAPVEDVAGLLGEQARQKDLTVSVEFSPDFPQAAVGDPLRLRQVLFNLIGNAVKFTLSGSVAIRADVAGDGGLRFEIADTGVGMEPEAAARLFAPFAQGDGSITRRFGGAGLGLLICKRLVERMGGEIGFLSTPGRGSTFWFTVAVGRPEAAPADAPAVPALDLPPPGLRILAADDNPTNRIVLKAMLGGFGWTLDLVENGAEAVAAFESGAPYDLVLMDVRMPVMDGLAAARAIRGQGGPAADIPIVAVTANALADQRASYLAAGMTDFVAKPLDVQKLLKAVARNAGRAAADRIPA